MIYSINEGQQAEEYKARKADALNKNNDMEASRNKRRYGSSIDIEIPGTYKSPGNTGNSDNDGKRADKVDTIVDRERSIRRDQYNTAHKKYVDEDNKAIEISKTHPGERPKGLFKGKQKSEYDDAYHKYKKQLEDQQEKVDTAWKNVKSNAQSYNRSTNVGVKDALNRHMRRHPDQYKESCGIFCSVNFI